MEKPDYDKIAMLETELGYRDLEAAIEAASPIAELVSTTYSRYNTYMMTMAGVSRPVELLIDEATRDPRWWEVDERD